MENCDSVISIYFSEVKDPRRDYSVDYPLEEILLLALCKILTGGKSISNMVLFGEHRLDFLRQYYPYKHGFAPYHTLRRVFMAIDPGVLKPFLFSGFKLFVNIISVSTLLLMEK